MTEIGTHQQNDNLGGLNVVHRNNERYRNA